MSEVLWTLSTALRGYLRLYLPSNRAADGLRASAGLSLASQLLGRWPRTTSSLQACARLSLNAVARAS